MSERYTVEYGEDARLVMIVNHMNKDAYTIFQACRELNRLAAQVATLRELLKELRQCTDRTAWNKAILKNIDAALADTETTG